MTALHERLQDVIAEMRDVAPTCDSDWFGQLTEWANAIEAATALQSSGGEVVAWLEPGTLNSASPDDYAAASAQWPDDYRDWFPVYASPAQPSGFVLVPVEPTRKMCDDAVHAAVHGSHGSPWFPHAWRAALKAAAAPAPIEQEG